MNEYDVPKEEIHFLEKRLSRYYWSTQKKETTHYSHKLITKHLKGALKEQFDKTGTHVWTRLHVQLPLTIETLGYKTKGKRLLDLGCGSTKNTAEARTYTNMYAPWLGRLLHAAKEELGIEYVGVDVGENNEPFTYHQLDLRKPNVLKEHFSKDEFDLVTAFNLFDSPNLELLTTGHSRRQASNQTARSLYDTLKQDINYVTKPEGVFMWYTDENVQNAITEPNNQMQINPDRVTTLIAQ